MPENLSKSAIDCLKIFHNIIVVSRIRGLSLIKLMTKIKSITEVEFDAFCKFVYSRLPAVSGFEETDLEILNFAIYWQLCYVLDQPLDFGNELDSKIIVYRQNIQNILCNRVAYPFDILQIIDKNVLEKVSDYSKTQLNADSLIREKIPPAYYPGINSVFTD